MIMYSVHVYVYLQYFVQRAGFILTLTVHDAVYVKNKTMQLHCKNII